MDRQSYLSRMVSLYAPKWHLSRLHVSCSSVMHCASGVVVVMCAIVTRAVIGLREGFMFKLFNFSDGNQASSPDC